MPTLNIGGQQVTVDDSFLKMSPEQQNATVEEIASSLPKSAAEPGIAEDVAKSTAIAVPETAIGMAGLPGTVSDIIGRGVNAAGNLITGKTGSYEDFKQKRAGALGGADIAAPTAQAIQSKVEEATGPFYEPKTLPGKVANTTTQFVLSGGRAGVGARAAAGVGSELAGQATEGTPLELPARVGGALLAGGTTAAIGNTRAARQAERAAAAVTPNTQELGNIVDQGYAAARNSGVQLAPDAVHGAIGNIRSTIAADIDPSLTPRINTILGQAQGRYAAPQQPAMAAMTGQTAAARAPVEFNELDALRRNLGAIAKDRMNPTEAAAARRAQTGLDNFIESLGTNPPAVLRGDATALARTAAEARGNAATEFRSTAVDALRERAALAAEKAHSGLNYENSLKKEVAAFVRPNNKGVSPAMKEGLNQAEITALRRSVGGTVGTRALRYAGNLLGGGGGLGSLAAFEVGNTEGGHGAGGLALGLGSVLAGRALRGTSNAIARRQAERLGTLIASRSPAAAAARAALAPPRAPTPLLTSSALPLALSIERHQR